MIASIVMTGRRDSVVIVCAIVGGLMLAAFLAVVTGAYHGTRFEDYQDDAEIYNRTAFHIIDDHAFAPPGELTVGAFRRAPGYPFFLAIIYNFFWRSPIAVWIVQAILFAMSILLLWRYAQKLLPRPFSLIPPVMLAGSWFVAVQVTRIIPELFTLFLLLVFLLSMERFLETKKNTLVVIAGSALTWIILIKPMALYFLPIIIAIFIWRMRSYHRRVLPLTLLLLPLIIFGGLWTARSINLFDTWQVQSGSYVIGWKSLEATAPWDRVVASFIGGAVGDVAADLYLPGYSADPEPYGYVTAVFNQMVELGKQGVPEVEKEKILYNEAKGRIVANPTKFFVAGITGFLRQNTPMNHKGQAMTHFLAEHDSLPVPLRLGIVLAIRALWYLLLFVALVGMWQLRAQWKLWLLPFIWLAAYNGLYAFFTHNEARYMIPVWPMVLLFFAVGVLSLQAKKKII